MRRLIALTTVCGLTLVGLVGVVAPAQGALPTTSGRIAYVTGEGGCCNISTMTADGSHVQQLTHLRGGDGAFDPSWSPDNSHLVFSRQHVGSQVWAMNADGSNQHRLLRDPFFLDFGASYSPDGAMLVFSRCRPDFQACAIYRIRADGTGLTAVTAMRASVRDFHPRYSPDGASIVFDSGGRGGIRHAVYLMHADGSHVRRLTRPGLLARSPDWSPDGRHIVFSAHCCGLIRQPVAIWVIGVDRSGLKELTFPGQRHDFAPSYAPAGNRIVFERDSPDFSLFAVWVMNSDGSGLTRIQPSPSGEPQWGNAA